MPLTSPLNVGRLGVKGFVDAGIGGAGRRRSSSDQRFDRGIGAGVFFTAPVVRVGLDVAWPRGGVDTPRTPRCAFRPGRHVLDSSALRPR